MQTNGNEAGRLQEQMHALRTSLGHDVHGLVESARSITDWHHYWRSHPWAWCGAAAVVGYLAVPARRMARGDVEKLVGLAESATAIPKASLTRKLISELAGMAVGFVAQRGLMFVSQRLDGMLASHGQNGSGSPRSETGGRSGAESGTRGKRRRRNHE